MDAPATTVVATAASSLAARRAEQEKKREERQERKRKNLLQQAGWKAIQLISAESVFWEDNALLLQALDILCRELKKQLQYTNEDATRGDDSPHHGDSGSVTFEILSLLHMLSHTPTAKIRIAEWENVSTLMGILNCAHAAPRSKRLALRLALRFLPHAEPPTSDNFYSLLEYFLDAIGSCLFDRQAKPVSPTTSSSGATLDSLPPAIHTVTTTSYTDYSSDEDDESDEGDGAEWEDGEDVDMCDEDMEDEEDEGAGVGEEPVAEPEAELFTVFLDVWTLGHKRYAITIFLYIYSWNYLFAVINAALVG